MIDANFNLKICGITDATTAMFCAQAGAGAVGAVFYKKSPRNVSVTQARDIFSRLPENVARVGVCVDMTAQEMIQIAHEVNLDTVQMHGCESVSDVAMVLQSGFHVVKVLKTAGKMLVEEASRIPQAAGILVECGKGILPGGNGAVWDWSAAAGLAGLRAFAVAGGLAPGNIRRAALCSKADAWDVSSGVETEPGLKDMSAVTALIGTVKQLGPCDRLFWRKSFEP
ncbi:MAG: phosphoribosylanthranilate isomerase [Kiritimatiellae bacterium]|nr:phosphoribosylanthranilate isomerase [Kiritimatiellia bacterium]